jgi:hypothetical protein
MKSLSREDASPSRTSLFRRQSSVIAHLNKDSLPRSKPSQDALALLWAETPWEAHDCTTRVRMQLMLDHAEGEFSVSWMLLANFTMQKKDFMLIEILKSCAKCCSYCLGGTVLGGWRSSLIC